MLEGSGTGGNTFGMGLAGETIFVWVLAGGWMTDFGRKTDLYVKLVGRELEGVFQRQFPANFLRAVIFEQKKPRLGSAPLQALGPYL